jgi:hypothetical protein
VPCWGSDINGQLGNGSTTESSFTPILVSSFTLNIEPTVELKASSRVATVNIIAVCDEGRELFVNVALTQGSVSGEGSGHGSCTGVLETYPVTVPARGQAAFNEGAAQVDANAIIRERGRIVDQQEWTREVELLGAP